MTTDLIQQQGRGSATRPPTGLLLSIGDKTLSRNNKEIPTRIDYFRPKEGALEQYAPAVAKFFEVYGEKPKALDDVYFLSNEIVDVLEIRLMAWGSSGVRLRGDTNYAALPRDEWEEAAFAFDDSATFYPLSADEIPAKYRDRWKGQPLPNQQLTGPDDARVKKYEINVEATLTFLLPEVMGVGMVAQITTKSKRSMRNLHSSVYDQANFFQGHLAGPPFRLSVRPARTRRFDEKERKMVPVEFFELVLDSTLTVTQIYKHIGERRAALGMSDQATEAAALRGALALPVATGETQQLREEPAAEADRPDDALLNRIAQLRTEVGETAADVTLQGVFGVDHVTDLDSGGAVQYETILLRAASAVAEHVDDVVVVDEAGAEIEWPGEAP